VIRLESEPVVPNLVQIHLQGIMHIFTYDFLYMHIFIKRHTGQTVCTF